MAKRGYTQGKFRCRNPKKYNGDHTKIVFRSSYELKMMHFCDMSPNVLAWSSEEHVIPYFYSIDQKVHRYFMDFYVRVKKADGTIDEQLIEVKPFAKTLPPKKRKRTTAKYIKEVSEYIKNQDKWAAAEQYAKARGMKFKIFTEKELGIH